MTASRMSAFFGDTGEPSILSDDKSVQHSRAASAKVAKKTAETGVNPGTIRGIARADRLATLIPKAHARKSGVR